MTMTNVVATSETDGCTNSQTTSSMAVVVREIPVILKPATIASGYALTQYYKNLRVEGFADLLPEQIEIDPTPIANGGDVRIDQIALPPCCEIIGVWFANPVISVERMY
jgi:hypothetical protein